MQNLKVDIIYHQSPSDFEMEFNLGSCCHMRLLSDRTGDKKSFIKALVRDVARSRVIMCCGPLFGNDGLISIVAKAIGAGTAQCDNKTYGINSDTDIDIINGSTPLVTPDGYFGGCIIESGPQTIILLTENRTFRKVIMKNLIHPYLQEISYIAPATHVVMTPPVANPTYDTAVTGEETYLTQVDDNYNNEPQEELMAREISDEHNIEFIMDGEETVTEETNQPVIQDDTQLNLYTVTETKEEIKARYETPYTPSESDQMFISDREHDEVAQKKAKKDKKRSINIAMVILVLLLLLAGLALVYLMVLRPLSMGLDVGEYIKEIFGSASSNTLV